MNAITPWKAARAAIAITAVAATVALLIPKSPQGIVAPTNPSAPASPSASILTAPRPDISRGHSNTQNQFHEASRLSRQSVASLRQRFQRAQSIRQRAIIARAMAMNGSPQAVLALLELIENEPNGSQRRQLAESLKDVTSLDGLESLLAAADSARRPEVLRQIIAAAGRLSTSESVELLVGLYRGEALFPGQLRAVTTTLSQMSHPGSARMLSTVASSATESGLIEAAAHGLAKIGNPTAVQGLVDSIGHVGTTQASLRRSLLTILSRVSNPASQAYRNNLLQQALPKDVLHALARPNRRTS